MAIAIIGGDPIRFQPYANLHRQVANDSGYAGTPISINMHGFVADTSQKAKELFWPGHKRGMDQIGGERGWPPQTREQFEFGCSPTGNLVVGSPQEVIEKIARVAEIFHNERFVMQMSVGHLPHADMMRGIELYGTVVAPAIREAFPHVATH
jgi:alkanesulfonate monooxygenase SsuD/methylene tetrahydromethanopterin reductase-like flavin-dependent oxidoreductase (luciferase family)